MILHHSSKSFLLKTSRSGSASLLHSPLLRRQRRRFDDELHHARLATSSYSSYAIPKSQCLWLPGEEKQGPWDLTKWATSVMNGLDEDGKKAKLREIRERETTQKLRHPPSQCGVYFQDSTVDELYMVNENTKNSNLAAGLRAYDHLLQTLARLHQEEDYDTMAEMLKSYQREKYSRDRCGATLSILDEGSMIEDGSLVGVKSPDRLEDIEWLARNYPSYALAKGIRIRSERIQFCAELLKRKDFEQLKMVLKPFERECILRKRYMDHRIDWGEPIDRNKRTLMRKVLTAVPRRVSFAHQQRSAVVVPICLAYGVPCLLFVPCTSSSLVKSASLEAKRNIRLILPSSRRGSVKWKKRSGGFRRTSRQSRLFDARGKSYKRFRAIIGLLLPLWVGSERLAGANCIHLQTRQQSFSPYPSPTFLMTICKPICPLLLSRTERCLGRSQS